MTTPNSAPQRTKSDEPPRPWKTEGLKDGDSRSNREPPKFNWKGPLLWGLLVYLAFFAFLSFQDFLSGPTTIPYTEFVKQVKAGNITEVYSKGETIQGDLKAPARLPGSDPATNYDKFVTERPTFAADDLLTELTDAGAVVRATPLVEQRGTFVNMLMSFAPWLLLIGFYVWLFRRQARAMGGGAGGMFGMGKKHKPVDPDSVRVTFNDVAGIDEVEEQVSEVVDFLRNPEKYRKLGARPPKGVLLTGGPGTGKTLLARATAGEAGVPFFSVSASEFIEMIVGVGAQRVRDLFEEARKAAPAIIFIDEIDTIGRARGGARSVGGNDEREQTLNQILTEMDGFDGSEGVVVLAATNRPDVLDPALTRPGRFDREITVHAPDRDGREAILRVHTRKVPLAADVDLTALARTTPGMTGADLANLANEAAILAARQGATVVHQADFLNALEKIQLGVARKVVMPAQERYRTAYHEAGHALLGMLTKGADPVRKVSIIPRGRALGVTLSTPEDDRYGYDAEYLRGRIVGALGGLAAERLVFGVTTTGVDSDLEMATGIARQMVGRWGMSEKVGAMSVLSTDVDPRMLGISEATLEHVDAEARRILDECTATALEVLAANRDKLDAIVAALMEHETLDEADAYAAAGVPRPVSTSED